MKMYYGVIEDRNDPLKIGRVRVRVHGVHTHMKDLISTMDLPWSTVIMPCTTPGLGGLGKSHSLVEGTTVVGTFLDKDKQQFVVMGVNQGISQKGFIENEKGVLTDNQTKHGFNDPRMKSVKDYDIDGTEVSAPKHSPARSHSMQYALDWYPHLLKSVEFNYFGNAKTKTEEYEDSEKTLPYYPLNTDVSDINVFDATSYGETSAWTDAPLYRDLSKIDMGKYAGDKKFPASLANPQYPFNNTTYTESGHLFELDDTRHYERVSLQHRIGTFFEWGPDGDAVQRISKNNYTVVCGSDYIFVGGDVNIRVMGNANIHANKDISIKGGADGKFQVAGKLELVAGDGDLSLESATAVVVRAPVFKPNS